MASRRLIVSLLLLAVLLIGAGVGGWQYYSRLSEPDVAATPPRTVPVEVTVAEIRTVTDKVETIGQTQAEDQIGIRPLVGGRLEALAFRPGDQVEAGQILATLDMETEEANLAEARAALIEANRALNRSLSLRTTQAVSQATVDEAQARRDAAAARVEAAAKDLDERTIRAPFPGVVGFNELDAGSRISAGELLTTLDNLDTIRVIFSIPERYYGRVRAGQLVAFSTPAFPDQVFTGLITYIDSRIGAESRAFRVRASHPNRDGTLPSGLTVNVEIILEEREALMIPEESVLAEAGGGVVFVIDDENRAHRRPVKTGLRTSNAVEIIEGLAAGDTIVRLGLQRLRDGMPVRMIENAGLSSGTANAP